MTDRLANLGQLLGRPIEGAGWYVADRLQLTTSEVKVLRDGAPVLETQPSIRWERPLRLSSKCAGCLDGFIHLHRATDAEIAAFARRFGPLFLCEQHREPFTHSRPAAEQRPMLLDGDPVRVSMCEPAQVEVLADWRRLSREAFETLRLAAQVARGEQVPERRVMMQGTINRWLKMSGVVPALWRPDDAHTALRLTLDCSTLFDVLALQLMLAATRADEFSTCAECGMVFVRKWKHTDRQRFCPACGARAARRAAQRAFRARGTVRKGEDDNG